MKSTCFSSIALVVGALLVALSCGAPARVLTLDDAPTVFDFSAELPRNARSFTYDIIDENHMQWGESNKAFLWSLSGGDIGPWLQCLMWIADPVVAQTISSGDLLVATGYKEAMSFNVGDKATASYGTEGILDAWVSSPSFGGYEQLAIKYDNVFVAILYSYITPQSGFSLQSLATTVVKHLDQYII
ncbi:MAG: hypothetical protein FWH51_02415 [Dehalococcoidia bacterium]|nr:hypothetical protein [Dehalococcoidia bacterium]